MADDETNVSLIPCTSKDFLYHTQCLTKEEIDLLKHPLPLTDLERQWKVLHDKLLHILFSDMDALVKHNILPQKISKLRGKSILLPWCIFGHMNKQMPYAEIEASLSTIAILVYCCGGVVFVVSF